MLVPPPKGFRQKVRARIRARVRFWVMGHQFRWWDEHGDINLQYAYPSFPSMRVIESVPSDREVPIIVGKYSGIHYQTVIIPGGVHHSDWVSTQHSLVDENGNWAQHPDGIHSRGPVVFGNDVLVAYDAVITSGITVGDGAIVATRAVVIKDVEPYSIVGGNPAKHIRYRFEEPVREGLLRIKWWDWPVKKVTAHSEQIHSNQVARFVEQHDPDLGPPTCEICRAWKD